jgi:hypothetical protein
MKMDMTKPCDTCPFRTDKPFYLNPERAEEIANGLLNNVTFSCHKTVDYSKGDDDEYGECEHIRDAEEQHCAGALIVLERLNRPHQLMRIYERLGGYDRTKLDMESPVYDTFEDWIDAMYELDEPKPKKKLKRKAAK